MRADGARRRAQAGLLRLLWLAAAWALLAPPALAQGEPLLRVHRSATGEAPAGARPLPLAADPSATAWVGEPVLDLPPSAVETVGVQREPGGTATVSLWLGGGPSAAFAEVTGRSVGGALAVVFDGRVLAVPTVQAPVSDGRVDIVGVPAAEAERVAAYVRGERAQSAARPDAAGTDAAGGTASGARPPIRRRPTPLPNDAAPPRVSPADVEPAPRGTPPPDSPGPNRPPVAPMRPEPGPAVPPAATGNAAAAETAASAFVEAVARRDWTAVADALHPDALRRLRAESRLILRLDGRAVRVTDGERSGTIQPDRVLGRRFTVRTLDSLSDRDLGALYLAGLDALGVWGPPGPRRTVVGAVPDGADLVHVLLRAGGASSGVSDVSVVTLRRDGAGAWRPLLTQPQGF